MSTTPLDIDRIVREVLQRIERNHDGVTPEVSSQPSTGAPDAYCSSDASELQLTGRVISLGHVEGKLRGLRQVTVCSGAIVTPSARDYLRAHDVRLTTRPTHAGRPAPAELSLTTFATDYDPRQLCQELEHAGIPCRIARGGSLSSVLSRWCRELSDGGVAMIVTGEPEVALCVANRSAAIRAFAVEDPARLMPLRRAIGGNLLIAHPNRCSDDDLRDMACAMANQASEIPLPWRDLL